MFTLPGGKSFRFLGALTKKEAEELVCSTALLHPPLRYFVNNAEWV